MKRFGKSILFGISGAALAVSSFSTPAAAYGPQSGTGTDTVGEVSDGLIPGQPVMHERGDGVNPPKELGDPSEWGVVKLEINDSIAAQLRGNTCENVTHGKWRYGYDVVSGGKKCYSNYIADVTHKSTVRVINVDHFKWLGGEGADFLRQPHTRCGIYLLCILR
ncbi:hypothetical protein [Streptomyces sp. NBC_01176]|uniref:hypothetical protein n=1 Tax=Streptomyces sp. NBC_01176 TaxID=2903760 RepID=UPI00386C44E1|nr:hypothetical protein OG199_26975 [Streptomyces sp. NBC_01176]